MGSARWLRFDRLTWARFRVTARFGSAAVIVVGAFSFIAWDRFGFQAVVAPRASFRILLLGLYGWIGLAGLVWLLGRWLVGDDTEWRVVLKLFGIAHVPVVLVAVAAQVSGVLFNFNGPGWIVAVFAVLVWMPGQIVGATRESFDIDSGRAAALCVVPYLVWLSIVGWFAIRQVGHLL